MRANKRASEGFEESACVYCKLAGIHHTKARHKCIQDIEKSAMTSLEGDVRQAKSQRKCSAINAFEMDSEKGRMATMEGFPFYDIPEIRLF